MYEVLGTITDSITNDTLHQVSIEAFNENFEKIKSTRSDFDGVYYFKFCSNRLISGTLLIRVTYPSYKQKIIRYKINSDSVINIKMTYDYDKTITKEKFESFLYFECGTSHHNELQLDELLYEENKTYRHFCSGEEKKYRNLIKDKVNFSEWILIEK